MRIALYILLFPVCCLAQGSFDPAAGQPGSLAIYKDSNIIKSWASTCVVNRGYIDIQDKSKGRVNYGKENYAIGKSDPGVISLGDSGVATLSFDGIVKNGPGPDFCVFENGFDDSFLELGFVEVSSDGTHYIRFKAVSETPTITQIGSFDILLPAQINNLAGKYRMQYGTPFDLEELKGNPLVNVDSIKFIRIIDVIGAIDSTFGSFDSAGNLINDPYPTDFINNGFYTGGFDLDAVGLINYEGEIFLSSNFAKNSVEMSVFPNPFTHHIEISSEWSSVQVFSLEGILIKGFNQFRTSLDLSDLDAGMYIIQVEGPGGKHTRRVVKS